jgi:transketolase
MSAQTLQDAYEIRKSIIQMLVEAKSGHAGGALGLADAFAVLYREVLRHSAQQPEWSDRDRVVLSNGHVCPVLYATLALHGYFSSDLLQNLRKISAPLQGHPHEDLQLGIETTSGPLGQGLSQAVGMALAARTLKRGHHIFCFTSDGEHQEGQTWEAYLTGKKYSLENLTVLIDRNFIQISGVTEQVSPLEPFVPKLQSFGWTVYEVNGHDHEQLKLVLQQAKEDQAPSVVVLYTEPGHGVDFMEAKYSWHGQPPDEQQAREALRQLNSLAGRLETQYD